MKVWIVYSGHFVAPFSVFIFAQFCNVKPALACAFRCPNMIKWHNKGIIRGYAILVYWEITCMHCLHIASYKRLFKSSGKRVKNSNSVGPRAENQVMEPLNLGKRISREN